MILQQTIPNPKSYRGLTPTLSRIRSEDSRSIALFGYVQFWFQIRKNAKKSNWSGEFRHSQKVQEGLRWRQGDHNDERRREGGKSGWPRLTEQADSPVHLFDALVADEILNPIVQPPTPREGVTRWVRLDRPLTTSQKAIDRGTCMPISVGQGPLKNSHASP